MEERYDTIRRKGKELLETLVANVSWMPIDGLRVEFMPDRSIDRRGVWTAFTLELFKKLWFFEERDQGAIKVGSDGYYYFFGRAPYYYQGDPLCPCVTSETVLRTKDGELIGFMCLFTDCVNMMEKERKSMGKEP